MLTDYAPEVISLAPVVGREGDDRHAVLRRRHVRRQLRRLQSRCRLGGPSAQRPNQLDGGRQRLRLQQTPVRARDDYLHTCVKKGQ